MRLLFLLSFLLRLVHTFIVGACIGPKSVLERYLHDADKDLLRKMVHTRFDGSNTEQVVKEVNAFVHSKVTAEEWRELMPELLEYQTREHECSIYAQLLPKTVYKQLLSSVFRASEMGASRFEVKRLVDDYVERIMRAGLVPEPPPATLTPIPLPVPVATSTQIVPITLPEPKPLSPNRSRTPMPSYLSVSEYPRRGVGYPRVSFVYPQSLVPSTTRLTPQPVFPIATPFERFDRFNYENQPLLRARGR